MWRIKPGPWVVDTMGPVNEDHLGRGGAIRCRYLGIYQRPILHGSRSFATTFVLTTDMLKGIHFDVRRDDAVLYDNERVTDNFTPHRFVVPVFILRAT